MISHHRLRVCEKGFSRKMDWEENYFMREIVYMGCDDELRVWDEESRVWFCCELVWIFILQGQNHKILEIAVVLGVHDGEVMETNGQWFGGWVWRDLE